MNELNTQRLHDTLEAQDARMHEPDHDAHDDECTDSNESTTESSEHPLGVPFGRVGINFLTTLLNYTLLLGLTMVVLIILRVFIPPIMFTP